LVLDDSVSARRKNSDSDWDLVVLELGVAEQENTQDTE
jgi:hypothetical protein